MAGHHFGPRAEARVQALQVMFQAEASGRSVEDLLSGDDYVVDPGPLADFGRELALGAYEHRGEIDASVGRVSNNWTVDRMMSCDRNLLRIAVFELFNRDEIDQAVTINEAVELAKAFGTDESPRFINGILGRLARLRDEGKDLAAIAAPQEGE